jgi:hypothetical protein
MKLTALYGDQSFEAALEEAVARLSAGPAELPRPRPKSRPKAPPVGAARGKRAPTKPAAAKSAPARSAAAKPAASKSSPRSASRGLEQVRLSQVPMLARTFADLEAGPEHPSPEARPMYLNFARRAATITIDSLATAGRPFAQRRADPLRNLTPADRVLAELLAAVARAESNRDDESSAGLRRRLDNAARVPPEHLGILLAAMVAVRRAGERKEDPVLALGRALSAELESLGIGHEADPYRFSLAVARAGARRLQWLSHERKTP